MAVPTDPRPTDPRPTDPRPTDPRPTDPRTTDRRTTDPRPTDRRTVIRTTCPRDCYDACGVLVVADGDRVRVTGDPGHPVSRGRLCGKCANAYNGAWRDPTARLGHALIRTGPKGEGTFRPATWDEALQLTADRLNGLLAAGQAERIVHTHYTGTCSMLAGSFPLRFFAAIGATEVDPDTVCNKAGHVGLAYVLGTSTEGFDPRWSDRTNTIVVWGANPSAAAPHAHRHWLTETPATVVMIDPLRHASADQADIHLALRPGTDAALAFGLMHVAWRDGLLDTEFIRDHTIGWDELAPAVSEATPQRSAARTGLSVAAIERVGRLYATGPSLLWLGQGMQRQRFGGNAFRAVAALAAVTGNIAKPAAGIYYLNGWETRRIDGDVVTRPDLAETTPASISHPSSAPRSISHMDLATVLTEPDQAAALISWNNNIVASSPEQARLRYALSRPDLFHLAIDLFSTDTTDYADVVFPAASFLEFDDLVASYFHHTLSAQVAALPAPGEALPNQEIFRRLAAAMGLDHPALLEADRPIIDRLLADSGVGLTFEQLAAVGTVEISGQPLVQFPDGVFPTPSGKVELASARAEADGHPRVPFPHADDPTGGDAVRVLSPASPWRMNSTYGNDAGIARRDPTPEVLVHPDDADRRGLADGAWIELANATGRLPVRVRRSEVAQVGVAVVYKGRWPKLDPSGANVNVLNPGDKSDLGESSCVHAVEAEIVVR